MEAGIEVKSDITACSNRLDPLPADLIEFEVEKDTTPARSVAALQQPLNTIELNECIKSKGWADDVLFRKIYPRLCEISHRQLRKGWRGETIETQELVSELYFKLCRENLPPMQNRGHFFAICARMVRQILIARVGHANSIVQGGGVKFVSLHESIKSVESALDDMLRLDSAMEKLRIYDTWLYKVASIHLYLEMTIPETALALEVSVSKAKADYRFAKAWLRNELS